MKSGALPRARARAERVGSVPRHGRSRGSSAGSTLRAQVRQAGPPVLGSTCTFSAKGRPFRPGAGPFSRRSDLAANAARARAAAGGTLRISRKHSPRAGRGARQAATFLKPQPARRPRRVPGCDFAENAGRGACQAATLPKNAARARAAAGAALRISRKHSPRAGRGWPDGHLCAAARNGNCVPPRDGNAYK